MIFWSYTTSHLEESVGLSDQKDPWAANKELHLTILNRND